MGLIDDLTSLALGKQSVQIEPMYALLAAVCFFAPARTYWLIP